MPLQAATKSVLFVAVIVLFTCVSMCSATTPPVLTLTDGTNTVTIDSTGNVTYSATCSCSTVNSSAGGGAVTWQGTIGGLTVRAASGKTRPLLASPQIDLQLSLINGSQSVTLTAQWTDVGFNGIGPAVMNETTTFILGSSSAIYTSYIDDGNIPFGTGTVVGTINAPPAGNSVLNGPGPANEPFSMTNVARVTLGPGARYSLDFSLQASQQPPQLTLTCPGAVAEQDSNPYNSSLVANGGVPPYSYSVIPANGLPPGLTLDMTSGVISGTPIQSGIFTFTAQVLDSSGNAAINTVDQTCTIKITPPPVSLTCPANTGQVAVPYDSFLVASQGVPPYTYSIQSGALPGGLTLNASTGEITGTPTAAGPFNFVAQVKDFSGGSSNTATANCTITDNSQPSATCVVINAVQGVPITPVQMVGSGGAGGPYTFSATGLPTGLTMVSDGTISGTPTATGTFPYTVTITDSAGHTGTVNCSVTVAPPPSSTCVVINAVQGVAITPVTMTGSGGVGGPYTFSATGLPAGLTMSASGTISGTPTVSGTFSYSVAVTDSAGNTGTANCSVTVAPPPTATCVVINAVQGVAITPVTMTGSGGLGGPYKFSATGLPAGLTMSSSGTISGTPTVSGTFNYSVTVTDSAGNTGTVNCSVTVASPPSATCVSITAVQGVAITPVTMTGSGGVGGPYTFSATGLPTGLTMSSSGTISGTPTVSGTFNYTVTIKDAASNTGTSNCSMAVAPPPTATCVSITAVQGVAITPVTMTGSGGAGGPYTFSATGLPPGLTMSSSGTISGTPTVNGTFPYTVTVKDSAGNSGTVNCSVTVTLPPTTGACSVINAIEGSSITPVTLAGSGGAGGPYTFSATGLPAGLTLSSTGTISGIPTVSGTFSYAVTVTDKNGNHGTFGCSVIVSPPACTIPGVTISNTSWNSFPIPSGTSPLVWVHAHIGSPKGISTTSVTTVLYTGVSISLNGTPYALPDGLVTFDPAAPLTISTAFNSAANRWETLVNPTRLSDEMFFTGAAIPVTPAIAAGAKATFTFTVLSSASNLSFPWQWSAAVYTYWPADWNQALIQPYHASYHAGTPLNATVQKSLIQGPRGGGGSNYTGSWSATGSGTCPAN